MPYFTEQKLPHDAHHESLIVKVEIVRSIGQSIDDGLGSTRMFGGELVRCICVPQATCSSARIAIDMHPR